MKLFKAMKRPVTLAIAAIMAVSLIPASPVSAKTEYETKSEDVILLIQKNILDFCRKLGIVGVNTF